MGVITGPAECLLWLADGWEQAIPGAVFSGVNGDLAHQSRPGKHLSRSQNRDKFGTNAWPLRHPKDRQGPSDKACAIDMSMPRRQLVLVHTRLRTIYLNRATDPRARYIAAFNGWDGQGSPGRYDLVAGTISTADDSHTFHEHGEFFYLYVGNDADSWAAARAFLSGVKGETVQQWLAAEQGGGEVELSTPGVQLISKPDVGVIWDKESTTVGGALSSLLFYTLWGRNLGMQNRALNEAANTAVEGLSRTVEALAAAVAAGGGDLDMVALRALLEETKAEIRAVGDRVATEARDAVADLAEGGAAQVRADG